MLTRPSFTLLGMALLAAPFGQRQNPSRAKTPPTIELRPGLVITQSARVAPRVYRFPAPDAGDSAVITVRGDDITLDFALSPANTSLDEIVVTSIAQSRVGGIRAEVADRP